jgi:hypothetical protein
MILLTADRMDVIGRCKFTIEADGASQKTTSPAKAAKLLSRLGVGDPSVLVEHARDWGFVEIVEAPQE